jgi:regulator of sigma E protease
MDTLIGILQAALGIGVLIFIHEAGHYLAARFAGVRVEVFSLGFGPRLLGFVWGGTDYRLSAVPVGGYVRVAGEDPTQRQHLAADDLYAKGFGARALFFSGGVLMNLLFALIVFPIVFHRGVEFTAPVLGSVDPGGAAWSAGLEPGDRVLELDGKPMYSFENLAVEVALAGSQGVDATVERADGERQRIRIRPRYSARQGLFELGAGADIERITVASVDEGSAAANAGLREGDEIVAVDGVALEPREVPARLAELDPGDTVRLGVLRDGDELAIEYPAGSRVAEIPRLGVSLAQRRITGLRGGAEVRALGLEVGDVLVEVEGREFWSADAELFPPASGELSVVVLRDGVRLPLSARLDETQRRALRDDIAFGPSDDRPRVVPSPDTPAARAGILPGDIVERIDGREIPDWLTLVDAVRSADTRPLSVVVSRDGRSETFELAPEKPTIADPGFTFGILDRRDIFQRTSIPGAIEAGFVASWDLVKQLYVTLKRIVTGDVAARNLGGIITISRVSFHYAQSGWERFLYFLAILSINLAFINVLPIPVLDGGHLMFLLIERIKGSPVSATVLNYSQILGLVFVLALLVFVTYHDILRLL